MKIPFCLGRACNGPCDVGAFAICPECVESYRAKITDLDQEIRERKTAHNVAVADLTAQRDSYERALKVIHVWAGTPGCLLPENVLQLTSKALGAKP